jgi:CRISPR-associated protein Cas2
MHQQLVLVAYDISSPRRSRLVRQSLRAHAVGGQKSLYECRLRITDLQTTIQRLGAQIDVRADRALIVALGREPAVRTLGIGCAPNDGNYFYLG